MASSSGTKEMGRPLLRRVMRAPTMVPEEEQPAGRFLSRRMTRAPTIVDLPEEEQPADSELVPSSLASIAPILRVANEIEHLNERVAYLCRFHAFEKVHTLDPTSSGRGVRQFKTYLLHRLEKDELETRPKLATNDPKEIQRFYQWYYDTYIKEGPRERKPEEMAKHYQIASVLYEVLKTVVPSEKVDAEINRYAGEVEKKKYGHYNILPLHFSGPAPAILELPEIKAAVKALRNVDNLPMPRVELPVHSQWKVDEDKSFHDLIDWLGLAFGFQKGNVENQKEHLILLLANIDTRNKHRGDNSPSSNENAVQLAAGTVRYLLEKIFKNYYSWCDYLHQEAKLMPGATEQLQLLYIGLYLLIWGEASNIRFMPECICYIFHHMAHELNGIVPHNVHLATGADFEPAFIGEEGFLQEVVTPIYQVMLKEAKRNKGGTASHSKWSNYDDLNEYFWSNECFKLGWPMKKEVFFVRTEDRQTKPEVNFLTSLQLGLTTKLNALLMYAIVLLLNKTWKHVIEKNLSYFDKIM